MTEQQWEALSKKIFEEEYNKKFPLYKRLWNFIFDNEKVELAKTGFMLGARWQRQALNKYDVRQK